MATMHIQALVKALRLGLLAAVTAWGATVAGASGQEEPVLNVYNWNDYIAKDTIARFEKETGIKVRYDLYDSNETLQAKLLTGKAGYDLVVPSLEFAGKQIQAGVHQKLDKALLPHWSNLSPAILAKVAAADPGNAYLVPYMWGTTALAINEDKVAKVLGGKLPDDAWQLLFDPAYTDRLKSCGISFMDTASDAYAMVNIFLGRPAGDYSEAALKADNAQLAKVRRGIRLFNSSPIDAMANGDLCVAMMFNGDAYMARNRARDAGNHQRIRYLLPKKGTILWVDNMAIPKSAPHPRNAHRFIDFILQPDVVAQISNEVFYANPNTKATPLVKAEIRDDPNIYLTDAVLQHLTPKKVIPADEQKRLTTFWNRFKTSR
jgi:putrescine transport system substrate-binding protein